MKAVTLQSEWCRATGQFIRRKAVNKQLKHAGLDIFLSTSKCILCSWFGMLNNYFLGKVDKEKEGYSCLLILANSQKCEEKVSFLALLWTDKYACCVTLVKYTVPCDL